jgi:hypothetical protein
VQTITVKGGKTLKARIEGLKKGSWQVRVRSWRRAEGSVCFSAWSGTKKVKIS